MGVRENAFIAKMGVRENASIAKMGSCENAFIAKMGSCENALVLQKEFKVDFSIFKSRSYITTLEKI